MKTGVVALVPDRWGGPWMPRHQILLRLSRKFPVVWVDHALPWREQIKGQPDAKLDSRDLAIADPENFILYRPGRFLGTFYRPRWLRNAIRQRRIRNAVEALRTVGCQRFVLYAWRPDFEYALNAYEWDRTLYHIDDEYSFDEDDTPISAEEQSLIEKCDHVIIHSTSLMARKGHINPKSTLIPNGVDYDAYTLCADEPPDLVSVPHPRIAYIGVIKQQLDFDVLLEVARTHPDKSLVMVGPINSHHDLDTPIEQLKALKNVYFLGNKSAHELPAYTQHMDIALLPYRVNHYTNSIYPLKLHEYLACGLPVLATSFQTAKDFSADIALAENAEAFAGLVNELLSSEHQSKESKRHRRSIAARHDWTVISDQIADLINP